MKIDKHEEFLTLLEKKYPFLFEKYRKGGNEIYVAPSWFQLIDDCCAEIVINDPTAQVIQIKEKFNDFRFYLDTNSQQIKNREIIDKYEEIASKTPITN